MAFSGIAAIATASAAGTAITATMVLAAVANVGTILTVVGAVTGSKDLMKIGGFMSLAGGVGGAIAGASSGAAGAATVADAAASQAGADALTATLEATATNVPTEALVAGAGENLASSLAPFQTAGPAITAPVTGGSGLISQALEPAATAATPAAQTTTSTLPGAPTVQGAVSPGALNTPAAPTVGDATAIKTPAGNTGAAVSSQSWWSGLSDNMQNTLVKTGAGLLQGASQASAARDAADQRREEFNMRYGYANQVPKGILKGAGA